MDYIAFERLDSENLDMALGAYMCFPKACREHMLDTMEFDWKLRTYPVFCNAFPADSAVLNSRWRQLKEGGPVRRIAPKAEDTALTRDEFLLLKTGSGSALKPVLDKMVAKLEPLKGQFPGISYADLYTLAGVTALEAAGLKVPWKAGRVDAMSPDAVTPDGRLPAWRLSFAVVVFSCPVFFPPKSDNQDSIH